MAQLDQFRTRMSSSKHTNRTKHPWSSEYQSARITMHVLVLAFVIAYRLQHAAVSRHQFVAALRPSTIKNSSYDYKLTGKKGGQTAVDKTHHALLLLLLSVV